MREQWGFEEDMKEALWNSKVFQCDDDNDGRDNHQNNNELKAIQKNNNDDRDHYNENNALWHLKAFQKKSRRQQNLEIYQVNTLHTKLMSKKENVKGQKYALHIMQHFLQMLASTVLSINEEISTYRCQVHLKQSFPPW